jgi:acid phosphatase type 7
MTEPMNRRTAMQRLAGLAAAPLLASCGADRLLAPSLTTGNLATGPIRLIGGGDPHMGGPTNRLQWKITDHIKAMLDADPAALAFCAGDLVPGKSGGTDAALQFRDHYHPSWGRFKDRTLPIMGNHDCDLDAGAAYYDYWSGLNAGARGKGYYSRLLGEHWLLVALNSQQVRPEQTAWLKELLPQHPTRHIIAMCHFPFLTNPCLHSGMPALMDWPGETGMGQFVKVLEQYGCEVYVAGHCHSYGRTPRVIRNPNSLRQPIVSERGMRQFVLGTAGVKPMTLTSLHPLMDANRTPGGRSIAGVKGVFEFALHPDRYEWKFTQVADLLALGSVRDSGTQLCRVRS